jgi:hypothetical protein
MNPEPDQLPVAADFCDPRSRDLAERYAVKMFLGKTPDQAGELFRQDFLSRQEDLSSMRVPAFQFYVLPAIKYLLSEDSLGDADAASSFSYLLESRLDSDPEPLNPIAPVVADAIHKILANFDRFDALQISTATSPVATKR